MNVNVACPKDYDPNADVMTVVKEYCEVGKLVAKTFCPAAGAWGGKPWLTGWPTDVVAAAAATHPSSETW